MYLLLDSRCFWSTFRKMLKHHFKIPWQSLIILLGTPLWRLICIISSRIIEFPRMTILSEYLTNFNKTALSCANIPIKSDCSASFSALLNFQILGVETLKFQWINVITHEWGNLISNSANFCDPVTCYSYDYHVLSMTFCKFYYSTPWFAHCRGENKNFVPVKICTSKTTCPI
jgi:hypothetical protein